MNLATVASRFSTASKSVVRSVMLGTGSKFPSVNSSFVDSLPFARFAAVTDVSLAFLDLFGFGKQNHRRQPQATMMINPIIASPVRMSPLVNINL